MKRLMLLLAATLLICLTLCAAADPLGWGVVNATDVALRRGVGGKVLVRLPENTCVWISDTSTDRSGVTWYKVRTGMNIDHANYDYTGWMMAEFIDAGDALWHDVTAIAAGSHGLIALRADGSTVCCGRPVVAMDGSGWVSPFGWADLWGTVSRVGVPGTGNEYFVVTAEGALVSSVNGAATADGHAKADALEAAEPVIAGEPFPAWHAETVVFRTAGLPDPKHPTRGLPIAAYVGVRADGTVIAEPPSVASRLDTWSDMADLRLTARHAMGLRRDGTVLIVPLQESAAPLDTSAWHDIVAIGLGSDWCVGLQSDGTLVFAGDHVFMNEGHARQ